MTLQIKIAELLKTPCIKEQAEGPPERFSPAIIAKNSNKKPYSVYIITLFDICLRNKDAGIKPLHFGQQFCLKLSSL